MTGTRVLVGSAELDTVVLLEIGADVGAALDGVAVAIATVTVTVTTEFWEGGSEGRVVSVVAAAATWKYLEGKPWG